MSREEKIAVIGSGLVGSSWAMIFISAGYKVSMFDSLPGQAEKAKGRVLDKLREMSAGGVLRGTQSAEDQFELLSVADTMEQCVQGAVYVQECVPEDVNIKRAAFLSVDRYAGERTILASSTSALHPDTFTDGIKHRNRVVVSHPTNPPYFCPLVEVMGSSWSDSDVVPSTRSLLESVGQIPVVIKQFRPGFVLNRLQYSLLNEAWNLAKEDVMSTEDIDKVLTAGLARRWAFIGPFETIHLNAEGTVSYMERYGEMIEAVSKTLSPYSPYSDPSQSHQEDIARQVERRMPLDMLEDFKAWRDRRLIAIDALIKDLDKKEPFPRK